MKLLLDANLSLRLVNKLKNHFQGFPPKVILLKTGNQSNNYLESLLIKHKPDIFSFYKNDEIGLLEIF